MKGAETDPISATFFQRNIFSDDLPDICRFKYVSKDVFRDI